MRALLLASVVVFGWIGAAGAAPITYNAVTDFSTASNPNGVWSYGYGTATATGLTFTAFTTASGAFGSPSWNLPALPLVGAAYAGGTVAVPGNDLWMHPGNADDLSAIVRFTAVFSGPYTLNAAFERADNVNGAGDGVVASLFQNSNRLTSTTLGTTYLNSYGIGGTLALSAGDTLSFVVARNRDYTFDSTGFRATISSNDAPTAVPEPASMAVLATGLLGLGLIRRRKRG